MSCNNGCNYGKSPSYIVHYGLPGSVHSKRYYNTGRTRWYPTTSSNNGKNAMNRYHLAARQTENYEYRSTMLGDYGPTYRGDVVIDRRINFN